ncbi:MAG TPA: hypothetical protein VF263_06145 [Longimicrobiaceae bacterium]
MAEKDLMLNSLALRDVAEFASSVRSPGGDPVYFVTTVDPATGRTRIKHVKEHSRCSGAHDVVVPADTTAVQPGRPLVADVTIRAEGMAEPESLNQYDAVFWSEASVEKFIFPYYASKCQWAAAHVLSVISQIFYGYVPDENRSNAVLAEEVPFAIAHLPRSEYVPIGDPTALGREMGVLFRNRETGAVTHRLLAEFL